jgi:hypothetical protein
MMVVYHPDFAKDIRKFEAEYSCAPFPSSSFTDSRVTVCSLARSTPAIPIR